MSDNDLIRRGDAILAVTAADKDCLGANGAREFIRAMPAVQVTVKPLKWHENPDVGEGGFIARGIFGVAYHAMADGWNYYRRGLWANAKSLTDAKAAAQADYEARILSALEPAPVTPAEAAKVQALVGALRSTLNFIQNTESEMGVILGCGDKARAALAAWKEAAK